MDVQEKNKKEKIIYKGVPLPEPGSPGGPLGFIVANKVRGQPVRIAFMLSPCFSLTLFEKKTILYLVINLINFNQSILVEDLCGGSS